MGTPIHAFLSRVAGPDVGVDGRRTIGVHRERAAYYATITCSSCECSLHKALYDFPFS